MMFSVQMQYNHNLTWLNFDYLSLSMVFIHSEPWEAVR